MKIITEYTDATCVEVIEIKSATYAGNFVINIEFNDGISQRVDFKPFLSHTLHPSIRQYLNEDKFQKFVITDGNLNWNDYALIFPIGELYKGQITN